MKVLAAALIATVAACAAQPKLVYYKSGASSFDRDTDAAACRAQAAAARVAIFSELQILHDCMIGKGWRQVPADQVPL